MTKFNGNLLKGWTSSCEGGRKRLMVGRLITWGEGRIQINWFGIGVAILIVALQHGDM